MCTVSIIPVDGTATGSSCGVRLVCNRDESRLRPPALPPEVREFGPHRAILPVDPVSGGTWIAANDAGLAMTLMNIYPAPFDRTEFLANADRYRSRGQIIPSLLHCSTLQEAVDLAGRIDPTDYPNFRLLILDGHTMAEVAVTDGRLRAGDPVPIDRPTMYASSGLGDALVQLPRRQLFEAMLAAGQNRRLAQDAFHRHRWPDRPHLSVCMSRPDARTVSLTAVEIGPKSVQLTYWPVPSRLDGPDDRLVHAKAIEGTIATLRSERPGPIDYSDECF